MIMATQQGMPVVVAAPSQTIPNPGGDSLQPTVDLLYKSLDSIKLLRCNVASLFETIATGARLEGQAGPHLSSEERERAFKSEFTIFMQKMVENVKELDSSLAALSQPMGPFNLGNSSLVNQDVAPDRIPLYSQLVDSYKWLEKVHEYSGLAGPMLSQNSLKRSYFNSSISLKRRRTIVNSYYAVPQETVTQLISQISNSYNDMDIRPSRVESVGGGFCLNVTLGRTLKAVVLLKGWLIEWAVIRGTTEEMLKEDGSLDVWTDSRYKVFQKVTDNANAAMLHFSAPTHPELSVKSFMTWLHSYITLFSQPCKKCGLHLSNNLPPTWRDLRSLEAFHEECKP